jgi:TfoX/Sxy family transcriptional regulator of competence genes
MMAVMAYDEVLAQRVRTLLGERTESEEKKMFGGLAFMVNTHMACGLIRDDLMVRVGKDNQEAALARGAKEMDFTGRPMRSMVRIPGDSVATDEGLAPWIDEAVAFARSEPPKKPKPAKTSAQRSQR